MTDTDVRAAGAVGSNDLLETRARMQQAVANLGVRALDGGDPQDLMNISVEMIAELLDVEYCKVLELLPGGEELLLRSGVGWQPGLVGQATVGSDQDSQAGYTLGSSKPVIVDDLRTESRFSGPQLLLDHDVVSGISVIIHGPEKPWGVLGAHTTRQYTFDSDDINFIQSVANILAAAIERSLAEDALSESEERFRTLVEMAPDAIFSISAIDGTFTSLSPAFEQLTGWSRSDWLGRSFSGIVDVDDLPFAFEQFDQLLHGVVPPPFELRVRSQDGRIIIGEFRLTPKIDDGSVVELFGIARDISDRWRAEEELRRSRDELEIILRGVADGITVQDAAGKLIYANQAAARMTGCETVEELLTTPVADLFARYQMLDDDGNEFPIERLPGRIALQGHESPETLIRFRVTATGQERWSFVSATPVLDQDGTIQYAINIFHDVTERKRAERVRDFLAEATTLLSSSLDYEETLSRVAHIAVPFLADLCVFDIVQKDGSLRRVAAHSNPESEQQILNLITRHPIEPHHPVMLAIREGRVTLHETVTTDSIVVAGLTAERVNLIDAIGFRSVIVVPLEAHGQRIGALSLMYAESERQYNRSDLEVATDLARRCATAIDHAHLFHEAQLAAARLRALAGASHAFAEASLDLQAVLDAVARSAGELIGDQCILRLLSDDGETLPIGAVFHANADRRAELMGILSAETQPADQGLVGRALTTGQSVFLPSVTRDELRSFITGGHAEDIKRVPLHSIIVVIVRVRDRMIGTLGLARERPGDPYTEEDLLLLQELADRAGLAIENARLYRQAQDAIRSREQFLSIASHELKTPLTSVKASAQLLERRLRQDPLDRTRVSPLVDQIQSEISRLENLVLDLLDATRIQQGHLELRREQCDVVELARQAIERFESIPQRLPEHDLVLDAPNPVVAMIDPGRIDQVITNLVSNALKYSPDGGRVVVSVAGESDMIEIEVTDQGIGISPEEQATLFQPFARGDVARQSIGGTGLGLFISAEIIERHGGTIGVESTLGVGSRFFVQLPCHPSPSA